MKGNQLVLHVITAYCFIAGLANASAIRGEGITDKCPASSSVYSTYGNISKGKAAKQSSICFGGNAAKAVDGNTSGSSEKTVTHTCKQDMNTWSVDVGPSIITRIIIWNRTDGDCYERIGTCWGDRLNGAKLEIFDGENLVASREVGSNKNSYSFRFKNRGTVVKISLANEFLSLAEVEVFGSTFTPVYKSGHKCEGANQYKNLGTNFMTPKQCLVAALELPGCGSSIMWTWSRNIYKELGCSCCVPGAIYTKHHNWDIYNQEQVNLSEGKAGRQSSTCYGGKASRAVDGNTSGSSEKTVTHTCKKGMNTWSVDVGPSIITKIVIWNRTDGDCYERIGTCWGDRLNGAKLEIFNGKNLVASQEVGSNKNSYNFEFEKLHGDVVMISLEDEFLSLAEVEVFGFAL